MSKVNQLTRIAGALKYGAFSGDNRKHVIIAYSFVVGIFATLMVLGMTLILKEQATNPNPISTFILALGGIIVGLPIVPIMWFFIIRKNEKMRKEVLVWLEDAVEVKAYSKTLDVFNTIFFPSVKIQVDFDIDGHHYSRCSEGKVLGGGVPEGYHNFWSKYADKEIDILYSPKYDQVLILKNPKTIRSKKHIGKDL